jgi:UDP-glucose 4-epimerase
MMKKMLVIGADGFIGSHCIRFFAEKEWDVWGADIHPAKLSKRYLIDASRPDFRHIFGGTDFDVCINASGSANVGYSLQHPDHDFDLNVANVNRLISAIYKYNPECAFVNFSSAAVYGNPQSLPISESQLPAPVSPYGFHKLQSEYLLKEYHRFFGLKTISLRVFSAYGPGLRKQLFYDLYQKLKHADEVDLFGTGNESRDFIYIEDLLHAVDCVISRGKLDGEAVNVASGNEDTIANVAAVFNEAMGGSKKIRFNGQIKQGDPLNWRADISRISAWGFKPVYNIRQGIPPTAQWLKENV